MFALPEKRHATHLAGQPWHNRRKTSFHSPISQQDLYITLSCQNFTVNTVTVSLWDFNSKANTYDLISNARAMNTYVQLLCFSSSTLDAVIDNAALARQLCFCTQAHTRF